MEMLKRKNDYTVIVFLEGQPNPKKWKFVHNLEKFANFLNKDHPTWSYMNVYNRRSFVFIRQFRRDTQIPAFPQS